MTYSQSGFEYPKHSKEGLDKEFIRLTLSMYNNPLMSRKAVDYVINEYLDFFSNNIIPYIQCLMETDVKPLQDSKESYYKVSFY